ncbi:MAG: hypothetical protein JXR70_04995 [Spirochaetales bacterium]|nr:hypothetical protein [Spirochaetales bacterium]
MKTLTSNLISLCGINGGTVWDRKDGSVYNPIGFSTIEILNVFADLKIDYKDENILNEALKKLISYYDIKTRLFKFADKSAKLPCITAKILSVLSKFNYPFSEKESCYQYFFDSQQEDGGWRCATVKIGKSPETDASNPGTTLYVLDSLRYRKNTKNEMEQLEKGVEFLLDHWVIKKPLGPCKFGIGSTFMKTEYPFIRYNIFFYSYVLSFYPKALKDKRFQQVLNELMKYETQTGIIINNPHKSWKKILYQDSQECELANNKYVELKQNISKS